jgi:hypothetical protein
MATRTVALSTNQLDPGRSDGANYAVCREGSVETWVTTSTKSV